MLTPHVRAIGRPAGPAQDDAVDAGLVEGTAAALKTGKCCCTPWSSKGYNRGHRWMAAAICDALWQWSGHGKLLPALTITGRLERAALHPTCSAPGEWGFARRPAARTNHSYSCWRN